MGYYNNCFIFQEEHSGIDDGKKQCCSIEEKAEITSRVRGILKSRKCPALPSKHYFYDRYDFFESEHLSGYSPIKYPTADDLKRDLYRYLYEYLQKEYIVIDNSGDNPCWEECEMLREKCTSCVRSNDPKTPCRNGCDFPFQISLSLKMDPTAFCHGGEHTEEEDSDFSECMVCKVNPTTENSVAEKHKKDDKYIKEIIISDFRYFGHPVKITLRYIHYSCDRKKKNMHNLFFLYGDSKDEHRVSRRLGMRIEDDFKGHVGPKYISEASAVPLGTIKAWRLEDGTLCKRSYDKNRANAVLHNSNKETVSFPTSNFMTTFSLATTPTGSSLLQDVYPMELWNQAELSLAKKDVEAPRGLGGTWASTFLLYYDYLCASSYDYPHVRALLACCMVAAHEFDPQGGISLNLYLKQALSEFGQTDSTLGKLIEAMVLGISEMILDDFPDVSASELYRRMAIRRRIWTYSPNQPNHRLDQKICSFWTVIRQTLEKSPAVSNRFFTQMDGSDLTVIKSFIENSTCSQEEIALAMVCYNPVMLSTLPTRQISNNYPDFKYTHLENGHFDYRTIRKGAISLHELHGLFECGLLNEDNTFPISPIDLAQFLQNRAKGQNDTYQRTGRRE